ncbi:MAG: hypothetical protein ACYDHH_01415 [Solirubrobacteraceae bacterium]
MSRGSLITGSLVALVVGAGAGAPAALAAHKAFGAPLSATPTLDTANGDLSNHGSTHGPRPAVLPNPHEAEDMGLWGAPGRGMTAPSGGQALSVRVKGCAIEDTSAPSQLSVGTPVNTIVFQALVPSGHNFTATATAGRFLMPFCSASADPAHGRVNTATVTSFTPLHLCLARGDVVAFHDIGGFIPPVGGRGPWYPQGVPFEVIAPVGGATMNSFVGAGAGTYGPGLYGVAEPNHKQSGFAVERGEQLQMQVNMGTGGDAYGLCPGGTAVEPTNSNRVICDNGKVTPGHKKCGGRAVDFVASEWRATTLSVGTVF